MLRLFRTNQLSAGIFLLLYALLLQLPPWLLHQYAYRAAEYSGGGVVGQAISQWMDGRVALNYLLPALLLSAQGLIVNVFVTRHRLSRKITLFAGLFLILAWAIVPGARTFHPAQISSILLLLALLALGRTYKREQPAVALFNCGAWLGLSLLFVPATLVLLPAFLVGVGVLRRPDFRSTAQLLTGTGVIVFLTATTAYVLGQFDAAVAVQWQGLGWLRLPVVSTVGIAGLVLAGLILLYTLYAQGSVVRLLNIEGKKNVTILFWVLLFAGIGYFFSGASGLGYLGLVTLVPGAVLGLSLIETDNGRAEFAHLVLLTAAVLLSVYAPVAGGGLT